MSQPATAIQVLGNGSAVMLASNLLHLSDDTVAKVKQVISGELKGAAASAVLSSAANEASASNAAFRATYVPPAPGPDVVERFVHRVEAKVTEWREKRAEKKAEREKKAADKVAAKAATEDAPGSTPAASGEDGSNE